MTMIKIVINKEVVIHYLKHIKNEESYDFWQTKNDTYLLIFTYPI